MNNDKPKPGTISPVLVLEGIGGSGRTEVLRQVWDRTSGRTPTVMVDPLAVAEEDADSMRDVLVAAMLGLTAAVPGYAVSFPRVLLAHIAMIAPMRHPDPEQRVREMLGRLSTYRNSGAVENLVGDLVRASGTYVRLPGADVVASVIASEVVRRLRRARWRTELTWNEPLTWFGHQDQRFHHDPLHALILLSAQAQSGNDAVRDDVDHLLMTALLADLRESLARAKGHRWNAVMLLENGDAPSATEFVRILINARHELAEQGVPPDPLTIVAASGGRLVATVAPARTRPAGLPESGLARLPAGDLIGAGPWLPVVLDGLTFDDVQRMARARVWPESLGTRVVATMVHRLTGGHAAGTGLLLNALQAAPQFINDLGAVLLRPAPRPGRTVERFLLDGVVAGLSPHGHVDPALAGDLVTLSAARDNDEARLLAPLMGNPPDFESELFASTTLWSAKSTAGRPALPPFVRYLLLRALADRPADHEAGWYQVFGRLRDHAEAAGDLGGRLHHESALGRVGVVIGELSGRFTSCAAEEWLALLDEAVAVPGPGRGKDPEPADVPEGEHGPRVARLVTALRALADLQLSDRDRLKNLCATVCENYQELAGRPGLAEHDQPLFRARARPYKECADLLA